MLLSFFTRSIQAVMRKMSFIETPGGKAEEPGAEALTSRKRFIPPNFPSPVRHLLFPGFPRGGTLQVTG